MPVAKSKSWELEGSTEWELVLMGIEEFHLGKMKHSGYDDGETE